eukprot:4788736-Ditylum_brightwellii.AAC.1
MLEHHNYTTAEMQVEHLSTRMHCASGTKDKTAVKLLWTFYQTCKSFDCEWSLVKRHIAIKKKGHPPKDGPMQE